MAVNSIARRKFLHAILVAAVCVSVFYVSEGNANKNGRAKSANEVIRRYCRAITWFNKRQRELCVKSPSLVHIVRKGVENALTECRRLFKFERWNCSPLTWNEVFSEGSILKKRSRETAFVQALTAAGVMTEIAKSCATGKYKYCGCGNHPKSSKTSRRRAPKDFSWDGCPDNLHFGAHFTKDFMDPRKITNHARKTKSHNQEVGRKLVRKLKTLKCKCHGKSDTCSYKTCWHIAPELNRVGDEIWQLFKNPIRSKWNKTEGKLYNNERTTRESSRGSSALNGKLAYFTESENFCDSNISKGIMGTRGRVCNASSTGRHNSCENMCCGRGHKSTVTTKKEKCNCKFVWCCNVECETCKRTQTVDTCL